MMHIFLQPEDVLQFRDGRPFNASDDHHARSLFPPLPSVMQGAVRSHYLVFKGIPLNDKTLIQATVGTADDYKTLRLRGPFLAKYDYEHRKLTRYFPTPADAFTMDDEEKTVQPAVLEKNPGTNSHAHLPCLLCKPAGAQTTKKKPGAWLSEEQLDQYLNGEKSQTTPESCLFERETRLGIELESNSRASKDQMLYQAEFIRSCDGVGLYLEVNGYPDWPKEGLMRIGGEGHGVRFFEAQAQHAWGAPNPLPPRFKVYFATPAYFEDGWRPKNWETFFEGSVALEAVAISGFLARGGFDYLKGRDKPGGRYVPAGSVYYFSHPGGARLKDGLTQNAITQRGAEIGFGQVFITEQKEK